MNPTVPPSGAPESGNVGSRAPSPRLPNVRAALFLLLLSLALPGCTSPEPDVPELIGGTESVPTLAPPGWLHVATRTPEPQKGNSDG